MNNTLFATQYLDQNGIWTVRAEEILPALERNAFRLIDVRRAEEWNGELGHIDQAQLVTLETDLPPFLEKFKNSDICHIFVCRSGGRSARACQLAQNQGFKNVFNLEGGMLLWNSLGYPIKK